MIGRLFRWALAALVVAGISTGATADVDPAARGLAIQAYNRASPLDSKPTVYNNAPAELPIYRTKVSQAGSGGAPVLVVQTGDSLTEGEGAGSGSGGIIGAREKNITANLAKMLATQTGLIVSTDSHFGYSGIATATPNADLGTYDTHINLGTDGTGWALGSESVGGKMWSSASGSTAITFTPRVAVDTITVWYARLSGQGVFALSDSNGQIGTNVDTSGGGAFLSVTFTRTASTLPISLTRVSGGALNIAGIEAYNSTSTNVRLINLGVGGTTAGNQAATTQAWSPANALKVIAPSLTIVNLGTNDQRHCDTDAPTYSAYMQTIITAAKVSGDVILVWHHPDNAPVCPQYTAPYRAAILALARTNNVPFVDFSERYGSYAVMVGCYWDSVHQLPCGYYDQAKALVPLLINAIDIRDLPPLPANDNDADQLAA